VLASCIRPRAALLYEHMFVSGPIHDRGAALTWI
jgi:hypothetical protein